jgi:hypothetical protein
MRHAQTSRLLFIAVILLMGLALPTAHAQQVSTSWNGGTGNWSNSTDWTPATVPNNNATTTYSVTVNVPSSVVTMDLLNDTIDNLSLGSTNLLIIGGDNSLNLISGASYNNGLVLIGGALTTAATFTNNGSLSMNFSFPNADATLTNSGTFINASSGSIGTNGFGNVITNTGTFTNFGSLTPNSAFLNYGTTYNSGEIGLLPAGSGDGSIGNFGTFVNTGTGTIDASGAGILNNGMFDNFGNLRNVALINNFGILNNNNSITNLLIIENFGTLTNTGTIINQVESLSGDVSELDNFGTLNNASGAYIINNEKIDNLTLGTFTNLGTLDNNSGASFTNTGVLLNAGTLNNYGTLTNNGTFANSGAVTISGSGLFTTSTNFTQTAGSTVVDGTLTASNGSIVNILGGTLGGAGTINGNVLMGGTLMPGDAPGTLTILGNYEQTSVGIFDEIISAQSQSFLDVSGSVTLDPGSLLEITLLNGFDPLNQTFSIMDFASLNGQFANGASFWDDGFLWDITYRQHEVDVTAVEAPEPSSVLLLLIGLAASISLGYRRIGKSSPLA